MSRWKKIATLLVLGLISLNTAVYIVGCDNDSGLEEVAEETDEAVEEAGDEVEDATDELD